MSRSEKRRRARAALWSRTALSVRGGAARPFLGVHFDCCQIYARIYRNHERTAYAGNCPRCSRPVRIIIGEGGTSDRFFNAG